MRHLRKLQLIGLGILLFILAACSAPAEEVDQDALTEAEERIAELEAQIAEGEAEGEEMEGEMEMLVSEPVTVRFLVPRWASTTDRRVERQIAFRSVIESFNERYGPQGITVEEVVGDGNPTTITQEIENGNVDVIWFNHSEYPDRLLSGQLLTLDPFMNGEDEMFFDWVQEAMRGVNGEVGALWHNTDTPLFYYNTEEIPEPPATWSELIAMAEQVRADEGGDVYGFSHPLVGWIQMNTGMYLALGGEFVDENGAPVAFEGENLEIWKTIFNHYIGLVENDLIPPSSVSNDQIQQLPDVYAGNVYSFVGNSNFHIRQLQPNLPPEEYEKWSAAPIPYPDEAGQGIYQAGGWLIGAVASGDPDRELAAALFTLHATNEESLAVTNKAGGWIPTRPAILSDDPFYADDFFAQVTLDALEQGHVVPLVPIYVPMFRAIDTALGRAASGEVTVDEALQDAADEVAREYEALTSGE